ncbi:MAG TPA: serine/threonine-protein kinase [Kofleriaceae bacterium]
MTIPAGTLVPRDARDFGSYQLLAKLATGGMAEIYLARPARTKMSPPPSSDDVLVLKRILPHLAEDDHFVTMFRDEADLASKLVHKNVCQVMSFGQYGGTWFIAMEYLHGVPLSRMMTRLSKSAKLLDYRVVAGIICQACEGLHSAHEARDDKGGLLGVVHRDVSPPNIMVTADGTVKLLDFGIAKARGANSRTRTGTVKGKNAYMSPEQILGKPLDRRSDVFALAVVMYEMLSIRRLFHRESDFLTFKAITEEPIPEIRDRRPDIPPGMRAALLQAMARDPGGRFESAQAFGNAIRNSVATQGGPASPSELAQLLSNDFGDEMMARDEILKAADDPNASPISVGIAPRPTPPPPPPITVLPARSGEMSQAPRARMPTGPNAAVPSMIVGQGTGKVSLPDLDQVLDLSANVGADSWMADDGTNLLAAHRWKSVRNSGIALAILAVVFIAIVFIVNSGGREEPVQHVAAPPADASIRKPIVDDVPIDAPDDHDTIVALSKYGFFSITATATSTVFVDDQRIGQTPLTRLPLKPGPHTVKVIGPKNKSKIIKVTIIGGRDEDEGTIEW